MSRGRLTERTQRLIEQKRTEQQMANARETASRKRTQGMVTGTALGAIGGLAAAPLLGAALPALTTAGAVVGGVGLGAVAGLSTSMFGGNIPAQAMGTVTEMFGNLPVDWGDVLNGTAFKSGMLSPKDIPLSALPDLPPELAGFELGPETSPKTAAPQAPAQPDVGAMQTGATPEAPLGAAFARPELARLGQRRLAIEPYLPSERRV
jgi:hypothetical protein